MSEADSNSIIWKVSLWLRSAANGQWLSIEHDRFPDRDPTEFCNSGRIIRIGLDLEQNSAGSDVHNGYPSYVDH